MELLKALFENAELPTDFKEKTTTLFEAAVDERVKSELATLQESFDAKLTEAKEAFAAESVAKIDALVEATVLEWAKENAVALDAEIKGQIAESFLQGLKGVFEKADIELNGDTAGKELVKLQEQNAELTKQAEADKAALVEAQTQLVQIKIKDIVEQATEGLAETQAHRAAKLCEAFDFKSEDDFRSKVAMVVEAIKGTQNADGTTIAVTSSTGVVSDKVTPTGTENEDGELVTKPAGASVPSAEGDTGKPKGNEGDPVTVKEAYEHARDNFAPHFEADMVAETLKLFK